jgi:hypothetical protein
MAYTTAEGRQQLLGALAEAIDEIGLALASLSAAYERLDIATADTLEEELFGPAQRAYWRAERTHVEFTERHGMAARVFEPQSGRDSLDRRQALHRPYGYGGPRGRWHPGDTAGLADAAGRGRRRAAAGPHGGEGADRRDHPPSPRASASTRALGPSPLSPCVAL